MRRKEELIPPCPSVHKGQRCRLLVGPAHHRLVETIGRTVLGLPTPVHQDADGNEWTAADVVAELERQR